MASNVSTNRFHVLTLIYMMLGWAWHSNPRPEPSSSGCSIPMEEILKGARNRRQAQLWCKCHYCRRCKVGLSVTVFGVIRHIQAVSLFLSAPLRFDMRQPPFLSQELYCRKEWRFSQLISQTQRSTYTFTKECGFYAFQIECIWFTVELFYPCHIGVLFFFNNIQTSV